jgi:hypothetical protein
LLSQEGLTTSLIIFIKQTNLTILFMGFKDTKAAKAATLDIPTTTALIICSKKEESIWGARVPAGVMGGCLILYLCLFHSLMSSTMKSQPAKR